MSSILEKINHLIENKDFEVALALISKMSDPLKKLYLELKWLTSQNKFEEAVSLIENSSFSLGEDKDQKEVSEIFYMTAYSYWKIKDLEMAKGLLNQSILFDRENENALWLRRELYGDVSKLNKYFSIMINGCWKKNETKNDIYFFTKYDVVSKNLTEALSVIKDFEIAEVDKELFEIEEFEELENYTKNPSGIYRTNPIHTYENEE